MASPSDIENLTQVDFTNKDEGEIIGYADPWIASPGQMVAVKVSHLLWRLGV